MKTGTYYLKMYPDQDGWPRRKLPGFFGPELPENAKPVEVILELYEKDEEKKAVLTAPNGKQKIGRVTESEYSMAFEAFSGEKGDQLFRFALTGSDSSHDVWGFAAGFDFHGFIGLKGEYGTRKG